LPDLLFQYDLRLILKNHDDRVLALDNHDLVVAFGTNAAKATLRFEREMELAVGNCAVRRKLLIVSGRYRKT
jgi:anaerobic selenocysteine-containing dehydrogenase